MIDVNALRNLESMQAPAIAQEYIATIINSRWTWPVSSDFMIVLVTIVVILALLFFVGTTALPIKN